MRALLVRLVVGDDLDGYECVHLLVEMNFDLVGAKLADRVVELRIVPDITDEAIRRLPKRTNSSPGSRRCG